MDSATSDSPYFFYKTHVYEGEGASEQNNMGSAPIPVTYREPDLQITNLVVPSGSVTSGDVLYRELDRLEHWQPRYAARFVVRCILPLSRSLARPGRYPLGQPSVTARS